MLSLPVLKNGKYVGLCLFSDIARNIYFHQNTLETVGYFSLPGFWLMRDGNKEHWYVPLGIFLSTQFVPFFPVKKRCSGFGVCLGF